MLLLFVIILSNSLLLISRAPIKQHRTERTNIANPSAANTCEAIKIAWQDKILLPKKIDALKKKLPPNLSVTMQEMCLCMKLGIKFANLAYTLGHITFDPQRLVDIYAKQAASSNDPAIITHLNGLPDKGQLNADLATYRAIKQAIQDEQRRRHQKMTVASEHHPPQI